MRNYATAQQTGTDPIQCDATAVSTAPDGTRAYVLLDGIGRSESVREWTRAAARRLARAASRRGDAEAGLRHVYNRYALERAPHGAGPKAAAVVAVVTPGKLTVAWCGDSRAYLITDGLVEKLTNDHNLRRVYPPTTSTPGATGTGSPPAWAAATATRTCSTPTGTPRSRPLPGPWRRPASSSPATARTSRSRTVATATTTPCSRSGRHTPPAP